MTNYEKIPIYHHEDDDLLGYIQSDGTSWQSLTIFGLPITRSINKTDAEAAVRAKGLAYLKGVWQYYDKDEHDWFPCVIKDAQEHRVIVHRTNVLGYEDVKYHKRVIIDDPTEDIFVKSA